MEDPKLFDHARSILREVEAHLTKTPDWNLPFLRSAWRETIGVPQYIRRGLRRSLRNGLKLYLWVLVFGVGAIVVQLLSVAVSSTLALAMSLAAFVIPILLITFSLPSTYDHGGVTSIDIEFARSAIHNRGIGSNLLDLLKSTVERLEQPAKSHMARLLSVPAAMWTYWVFCFWGTLNPNGVPAGALAGVYFAGYTVVMALFFLLTHGYTEARYLLYTSIYHAIDDCKAAALKNPQTASSTGDSNLHAMSGRNADVMEALKLLLSSRNRDLRPGKSLKFDCGERLMRLREEIGLSPSQFIELIRFPSEKLYLRIEDREEEVDESFLAAAARETGVSLEWLKHRTTPMFEPKRINAASRGAFDEVRDLQLNKLIMLIDESSYALHGIGHVKPHKWIVIDFCPALAFHTWWGSETHDIPDIRELVEGCLSNLRATRVDTYLIRDANFFEELKAVNKHPNLIIPTLCDPSKAKSLLWWQLLPDDRISPNGGFSSEVLTNIRNGFRDYGNRPKVASTEFATSAAPRR